MSRSINTKFTVSADRPAFVYYTLQIQMSLLLTGATIQLAIYDEIDNETILSTSTHAYLSNLSTVYVQLSGFVPAGYQVQLKKTGTATVSVLNEQETII